MKVALFPFYEVFCKDEIFNLSSIYNRDNCLYPYYYLQKKLNSMGVELHTFDIGILQEYDKFIMFNYNETISHIIGSFFKRQDKILYIFEPPAILPGMWSKKSLHQYKETFSRVYTYADTLIDNQTYFKFNFPQSIPENDTVQNDIAQNRQFLLAFIGSNHTSEYPGELYTLRRQFVNFFGGYMENFHVFGNSWDCKVFHGRCPNKYQTLRNYTFSLCIENYAMDGYVSEKIFDSFFAGTIPVYFGAPNITTHIPKNTFIHIRDYNSVELLVEELIHLKLSQIETYRQNIQSFLASKDFYPYSTDHFVETVLSGLGL